MKRIAKFVAVIALAVAAMGLTGCIRPYDKPELVEITPSQSVVVIPLEGKTSDQGKNPSADFYKQHLVYSKRVQVPHKWIQMGWFTSDGKYVPTVRVIVVERKPVVREWTDAGDTGTSTKNQAFVAESGESIGFKARMTASAQIDEENVPDFLYRYNGKPLEEIMDTDLRNYAAGVFTEECAKLSVDQILAHKAEIMDTVRKNTVSTFAKRGVTVTALNLVGEFTYLDPNIQTVINKVFQADRENKAQTLLNEKMIAEAKAKATAGQLLSSGVGLELKKLELRQQEIDNETAWIEAWKSGGSKVPEVVTGGNASFLYSRPSDK